MSGVQQAAEAAYPIDYATAEDGSEWDVNLASRAAFITGAEWALEQAALEAEAVGDYYPVDLWPAITSAQQQALHEFAKTLGMADGSRFHVAGMRHALTLAAAAIRSLSTTTTKEEK